MAGFQLESKFTPQGDQPEAIRQLTEGLEREDKEQVLLGAGAARSVQGDPGPRSPRT